MSRSRSDQPTMIEGWGALRADYTAAKNNRFRRRLTGVQALGSGGDYHYRLEPQFLYMIELARSFDRNDVVVGQAVTRLVNNVLQDGVKLDARTGDSDLDDHLTRKWAEWSSDADKCDTAREHSLHRKAKLTLRAVIVDGDICHLPLKDGSLDSVEAHRLRNPKKNTRKLVHGVLLDENRRRLEYWFTKNDISPLGPGPLFRDMRPYKARDKEGWRQVFHVYNPKRFSQTRGVSALVPIADTVGMHDDLQFAHLVKAQVSAAYAILEEVDVMGASAQSAQTGNQASETRDDGSTQITEELSPGMRIRGAPGTKLTGFTPNIPNPEFFPHTMLVLSFIAVNLEMPVQMLLLDPTKTTFSSWRGATDQARIGFKEIQAWMIEKFYRPVYLWKVRQWLAQDTDLQRLVAGAEAQSNADVFAHRFNPPTWPYIQPEKDAQADVIRLSNGLTSPRRLQAERGRDYDDLYVEIVEDRAKMIRRAMEETKLIKGEFPEIANDLDWRELGPGTPGTQLTPGVPDKEPDTKRNRGEREKGTGTSGQQSAISDQVRPGLPLHDSANDDPLNRDRETALAGNNGKELSTGQAVVSRQ